MKQLLIFSAAVAVTLLGLGDAALADCAPVFSNQTCTNSTILSGGQVGITDNGTTLTVTNTAPGSISGSQAGIFADDNVNVTNSGTIFGGRDFGIGAIGTATVTNSGTISGGTNGIAANIVNVTNLGTISATGTFISNGISAGTANVTNSGTISATGTRSFGIDADTANVTNSGTIAGGFSGIDANTATVFNSGTISATGTGGLGISAGAANITNSGTSRGKPAYLPMTAPSSSIPAASSAPAAPRSISAFLHRIH